MRRVHVKLFRCLLLIPVLPCVGWAARVGLDNASNPNYPAIGSPEAVSTNSLGWQDRGNISGTPFGWWNFEGNGDWAVGTASQSTLGGGSTALDTGGKSLLLKGANIPAGPGGIPAVVGGFTKATRYIDPDGLAVGQYFSFDLAVNFRNGYKGVDIFNSVGEKIFNFNVGGDDYTINTVSIGNDYSSVSMFNIRFEQTSANGGVWT